MKRIIVIFFLSIFLTIPALAWPQAPALSKPFALEANGETIDILGKGHAAPCYADIDRDNVPDLLVGEFKGGTLRIYHNHGTATKPVFKDFYHLEVDGELAVIPPS